MTSVADDLQKLSTLRSQGVLTDDEFRVQKTRLLGGATHGAAAAAPQPLPATHLGEAIATTLFCFLPFGVVGIVKASGVQAAHAQGQYDRAQQLSREAHGWSVAAFVVGLVILVGMIASGGLGG